ncbi:hypothetical protein D9756_005725 [Leucocoprinus leucothites]|uniref:Uncharacterized protein n=1 Tax=Leucocoprinus leucothites TaxID=201217 RepID=A0A8H5D853_9AGAR|nr:hypothetical protein D9756_005725 [Leucoagaricus leucothites]
MEAMITADHKHGDEYLHRPVLATETLQQNERVVDEERFKTGFDPRRAWRKGAFSVIAVRRMVILANQQHDASAE